MHYLITGHTGFKGAWLALVLHSQGHRVSGLALDPVPDSLYEIAGVADVVDIDRRVDVTDQTLTANAVQEIAPDVVFHMAAQPLVRESYRDPRTTLVTNVIGTLNVLEAVAAAPSVRAHVVITTDKVYRNVGQARGYREDDPLGAADPYSSSKAMADILAQSWVKSFPGPPTAIARGGNVVGGGDISRDRLIPDLIRSLSHDEAPVLRFPGSTRPWQHVLDCLDGYLTLSEKLLQGQGLGEWNFGPGPESFVEVGEVARLTSELWGGDGTWQSSGEDHLHEANLLSLDPGKAERELGWSNRLKFPASLEWVVDWHRAVLGGADPRTVTQSQIARYDSIKRDGT